MPEAARSPDVFVSYSRRFQDLVHADELCTILRAARLEPWIDRQALRNRAGFDFSEEMYRAAETARALVVVLSPNAIGSEFVLREISVAVHSGRPIVPCYVIPTDLSRAPSASLRAWLLPLQRLELFAIPKHHWATHLLASLETHGLAVKWPANVPRAAVDESLEIDAVWPSYCVLTDMNPAQVSQAAARLAAGLQTNPRYGYGQMNLGLLALHARDHLRALDHLRAAARLLPERAEAHYGLALGLASSQPLRSIPKLYRDELECSLASALAADPSVAHIHYLQALLIEGYYDRNGLRRPGAPSAAVALERGLRSTQDRCEKVRLLDSIQPNDSPVARCIANS